MSENSKIEWTDHTFNPWEGCQKVGPGCDNCYAETRNARYAGGTAINWGPGAPRRRTSPGNWRKPLQWNAAHDEFFASHRRRQRVFCASLADVFDNAVDAAWRADLFRLIRSTPNLDWLLLTKRIANAGQMIDDARDADALGPVWPWDNVWLGATIVNQEEADRDIPKLLATPAHIRFLSMEPLLEPVSLQQEWLARNFGGRCPFPKLADEHRTRYIDLLDWVIVGGESGPNARPMHPDWARDIRDECETAGVAYLFKQWGEWAPGENAPGPQTRTEKTAWLTFGDTWQFGRITPKAGEEMHSDDSPDVWRFGKKGAGRHLDGRTHDEFPQDVA